MTIPVTIPLDIWDDTLAEVRARVWLSASVVEDPDGRLLSRDLWVGWCRFNGTPLEEWGEGKNPAVAGMRRHRLVRMFQEGTNAPTMIRLRSIGQGANSPRWGWSGYRLRE